MFGSKCRAWSINEKKFVEVLSISHDNTQGIFGIVACPDGYSDRIYWDKNCKFMWYTGIKDKEDNEVYGGDIVSFFYTNGFSSGTVDFTAEIVFENFGWAFKLTSGKVVPFSDFDTNKISGAIRKLGNRYENPNLLDKFKI